MNMVEGLELLTGKAPKPHEGRAMALEDGSRVAVIGAGPAGSMFSYFFLSMAETIGLDVKVDIFEPRSFCHRGPAGCNHCGGIVSESLVQRLATEGIRLPDCVVQRGIESYTLHMDVGDVEIATPLMEKRIAAIYRGNGPRSSEPLDTQSFDGYLLDLAKQKGARVIPRLVTGLRREKDSMTVQCADQSSDSYELAVVATGVNSRLTEMLENESGEFARPDRTKTFICEFHLGRKLIRETFGPSMHVFLLDIPTRHLSTSSSAPRRSASVFPMVLSPDTSATAIPASTSARQRLSMAIAWFLLATAELHACSRTALARPIGRPKPLPRRRYSTA
jgi:hypothetical protein